MRDSPLFLDADAAVETLQNPPECTEDQNINTTEVKTTHFLNFLLFTMDAGRQAGGNATHNRAGQNTSSDAQRESLDILEASTASTLNWRQQVEQQRNKASTLSAEEGKQHMTTQSNKN